MTRSSTASCAILLAVCCVIDGSKARMFAAMPTPGMVGSLQTCAEAVVGPVLEAGGSAPAAAVETQVPTAGPDPTLSATAGVVPSDSPATGTGPWVEMSEA